MLTQSETAMIWRVRRHLDGSKPVAKDAMPALLAELDAALAASADARAAMAASAAERQRHGAAKAGRAALTVRVECDPLWGPVDCAGSAAAARMINEELTKHGQPPISVSGFGVMLSRNGNWHRTLETADGTLMLSAVRLQNQP